MLPGDSSGRPPGSWQIARQSHAATSRWSRERVRLGKRGAQPREVDFVVRAGKALITIEVKSGRSPDSLPGLGVFAATFRPRRTLLVGGDGIPLEDS